MRVTPATSDGWTRRSARRWRLRFVVFVVRMCRRCEWRHLKPPAPFLKRFAAPRFVFNFGISSSALCALVIVPLKQPPGLLPGLSRSFPAAFFPAAIAPLLLRVDDHYHLPTLEPRTLLDGPILRQIPLDTLEKLHAEVLMGHFAPTES